MHRNVPIINRENVDYNSITHETVFFSITKVCETIEIYLSKAIATVMKMEAVKVNCVKGYNR